MAEYKSAYTGPQIDAAIAKADTSVQPADLANKQDTLVSGTNIKTINNQSLLGEGNIDISGGGGAGGYTYHVNALVLIKDDEIDETLAIQSTDSWSDVEDAVANGETVNIRLNLDTPDLYLEKTVAVDASGVINGGSVLVPTKLEEPEQGNYAIVYLSNLTSDKDNGNDIFDVTVGTVGNDAMTTTYNRAVIRLDSYATYNLNITECWYYDDKENQQYLSIHSYNGTYYTDTFDVSGGDNMPELHFTFEVNSFIENDVLKIGYQRALDSDDLHDYDVYANDNYHSGNSYTFFLPTKVQRDNNDDDEIELDAIFGDEQYILHCEEHRLIIRDNEVYSSVSYLENEIRELEDGITPQGLTVENGSINQEDARDTVAECLYEYDDDKEKYERSYVAKSAVIRIDDTNLDAQFPAYFDYTGLNLPYNLYSLQEVYNATADVQIKGQCGTKAYTIKPKKSATINYNVNTPNNYEYYDGLDTSGMLAVTATYDSNEGVWTFNKPFSELFSQETKASGILLTVVNMNQASYGEIGWDVESDGQGGWNTVGVTYSQALEFDTNRFVGAYHYNQYHEGYGNVEWDSNIEIAVEREYICESKDLAAVPTLSIVGNLSTNINGYQLQTFEVSEQQSGGGYSWYVITRNGSPLTYTDAEDYMEYMTGSRFVPVYDLQKPLNSLFIDGQMHLYKPQFDENGLKIYVIPFNLPS